MFTPLVEFVPDTPATAEDQNSQDQDIADGLTQCILKNGDSVMTGDLDMDGHKIVNLGPGTASTDAATYGQILNFVPIGVVLDYAGATAPNSSWMVCDGSAISRTTYATLFAICGTSYGEGDMSSTFNIPDTRGRVVAAVDPTVTILTSATMTPSGTVLGATGGAETHALSTPELASHTHTANVTDPGHVHANAAACADLGAVFAPGIAVSAGNVTSANVTTNTTGITVTNTSTGSGTAHLNVQPTLLMQKIIKVQ